MLFVSVCNFSGCEGREGVDWILKTKVILVPNSTRDILHLLSTSSIEDWIQFDIS